MPYILLHKKVRNDDHCPICRMFYVSVHKTMEQALKKVSENDIIIEHNDDNDIKKLEKGFVLWIDEWVRRKNGDKFQIAEICPDFTYDLDNYDLTSYSNDYSNNETTEDFQYMLLNVSVNKHNWCPDNISFSISFHTSLESANKKVAMLIDNENDKEKIGKLEGVWKNNEDYDEKEGNGEYYQVIKLSQNETICLNTFCPQIQPDVW